MVLGAAAPDPEQAVSHQVTILLCDGTSAAESPEAILCSCAGQLGPQRNRLFAPLTFLRVDASHALFVFGTLPPSEGRADGGAQVRMTNDEILMTKDILNPNSKWEARAPNVIIRSFELRHSFDIRHSDFVVVRSLLTSAATKL